MFNFQRLIRKYSVTFGIVYPSNPDAKPQYDDLGNKIPAPVITKNETGALLPVNERMIYQSGGRLTSSDRLLYSLNHHIPDGAKITYKGYTYRVQEKFDGSDFADFSRYSLKAVEHVD